MVEVILALVGKLGRRYWVCSRLELTFWPGGQRPVPPWLAVYGEIRQHNLVSFVLLPLRSQENTGQQTEGGVSFMPSDVPTINCDGIDFQSAVTLLLWLSADITAQRERSGCS